MRLVAQKTTGNSNLSPNNYFIGRRGNLGLKITTNNTDRIYITENGRGVITTFQPRPTLEVNGSISRKVSIITSNLNLDETYHTVLVNSPNNVTITLPTASFMNAGVGYVIKINSGIVTISGSIEDASVNLNLSQRESIELVSNGSTWVVTNSFQPVPPIGSVIVWLKNMDGKASLLYGCVECNGQTLNDPASLYNNQIISNLNDNVNGANSPGLTEKVGMFLRGGTTSGNGQYVAFQVNYHSVAYNTIIYPFESHKNEWLNRDRNYRLASASGSIQDPTIDGTNGALQTADETRPKDMSVVWIMRVK